jgi:pimeloyl-ACP methyl ester carboxylesterase
MKSLSKFSLILSLLLFLCLFFTPNLETNAQTVDNGIINGAAYSIRIPNNWNKTLVIYAHGYRLKANRPGEPEDHNAYPAPTPLDWPALPEMEQFLLSKGYALAGSSYKQNGFAVEEGIEDTKALAHYFKDRYGKADRTIVLGFSMGGLIGAALMEKDSDFDGGILLGGLVSGTPLTIDRAMIDFAATYDAAFGIPASWGTLTNINPNVDFQTEVIPEFIGKLSDPANFGKFEFIRLALQLPAENFYGGGPNVPTLFFLGAIMTEARSEIEARAGGRAAQNLDHTYRLSANDKAYLTSLGVNPDSLLNAANARRFVAAEKDARKYVKRNSIPSGKICGPVITVHGVGDGINPPDQESVYKLYIKDAKREGSLLQVYTESLGHGDFTQQQLLTSIQAMESWLKTKKKPSLSVFPPSQGFIPGYVPPAWPQPVNIKK